MARKLSNVGVPKSPAKPVRYKTGRQDVVAVPSRRRATGGDIEWGFKRGSPMRPQPKRY